MALSLPFEYCAFSVACVYSIYPVTRHPSNLRTIVIVSAIASAIAQPYKLHPQASRTMLSTLHPHLTTHRVFCFHGVVVLLDGER